MRCMDTLSPGWQVHPSPSLAYSVPVRQGKRLARLVGVRKQRASKHLCARLACKLANWPALHPSNLALLGWMRSTTEQLATCKSITIQLIVW